VVKAYTDQQWFNHAHPQARPPTWSKLTQINNDSITLILKQDHTRGQSSHRSTMIQSCSSSSRTTHVVKAHTGRPQCQAVNQMHEYCNSCQQKRRLNRNMYVYTCILSVHRLIDSTAMLLIISNFNKVKSIKANRQKATTFRSY